MRSFQWYTYKYWRLFSACFSFTSFCSSFTSCCTSFYNALSTYCSPVFIILSETTSTPRLGLLGEILRLSTTPASSLLQLPQDFIPVWAALLFVAVELVFSSSYMVICTLWGFKTSSSSSPPIRASSYCRTRWSLECVWLSRQNTTADSLV